jgi:hypothetical protein
LPILVTSLDGRLQAENNAPRTIAGGTEAVRLLSAFLAERGMPGDLADLTREHIEEFIADILTRCTSSMANVRFGAPQHLVKQHAVERADTRPLQEWENDFPCPAEAGRF